MQPRPLPPYRLGPRPGGVRLRLLGIHRAARVDEPYEGRCSDDVLDADGDRIAESSVAFKAKAGTPYLFQVGGALGDVGDLEFRLRKVTPPANDDFGGAFDIPALPFQATAQTRNATHQAGEAICFTEEHSTVWYRFMTGEDTPLRLSILSRSGTAGVWKGGSLSSLDLLECASAASPYRFVAKAGVEYHIRITAPGGSSGPVEWRLVSLTP